MFQTRVPLQVLDEGQVGLLVDLFEDGVEVADRLVRVNQKNQMKGGHSSAPPAIPSCYGKTARQAAGSRGGYPTAGGTPRLC